MKAKFNRHSSCTAIFFVVTPAAPTGQMTLPTKQSGRYFCTLPVHSVSRRSFGDIVFVNSERSPRVDVTVDVDSVVHYRLEAAEDQVDSLSPGFHESQVESVIEYYQILINVAELGK